MAEDVRALLKRIRKNLKVTKVVCTRAVKSRSGDTYVGFSAAWDTTQDDVAGASDLISTQSAEEVSLMTDQGLSLKDSRIAALVLGMQADIAAHNHAMAGGTITQSQRDEAVKAIKHNYSRLLVESLGGEEKNEY